MYDFNKIIDRKEQCSFKWNRYKDKDVLPMWVADSEFKAAPAIVNALNKEIQHGIFGYTHPDEYIPAKLAIQRWLAEKHDWRIELDWVVWTPGVVPAFNLACKGFCQAGDKVIYQVPNYPPLMAAPALNQLGSLKIDTVQTEQRWTLDFDQLRDAAKDPKAKLFILCNPMNPVGTTLSKAELDLVIDICQENGVQLCSDEIHADLILDKSKTHFPAGKYDETAITLMAASKTFNVAGLGTSFAIIPNSGIRRQFRQTMQGLQPWVSKFGLLATEKAFTECDDWYHALINYLTDNRNFLWHHINKVAGLSYTPAEATYLAWVDCTNLQLTDSQDWFEQRGIGPSPGRDFGWSNYARINFACSRTYLETAVARISE